MYGATDHGNNREWQMRYTSNAAMLRNPRLLLGAMERNAVRPYEVALLMCPVNPSKNKGYGKMIDMTVRILEGHLAHLEDCGCKSDPANAAEVIMEMKRIWGIFHDPEGVINA
jgi:hypothetical protein